MIKSHILWTAPRCLGTAFELMIEARGDFRIEANVFDHVYYFLDGAGTDRPEPPPTLPGSFVAVYQNLITRSRVQSTFVRSAAYTVTRHLDEVDWSGFRHTILIRDPRYALPSHRRFVAEITLEEAGFVAQLEVFRHLASASDTPPVIIDAHDLLQHPEAVLHSWCAQQELPYLQRALRWKSGYRSRWSMWGRWKDDAANSNGFNSFAENPLVEISGTNDALFSACHNAYTELHRERLQPPANHCTGQTARHVIATARGDS